MNDYRINLNYAKALFMLSQDLNQTETVYRDMVLVHQVCSENSVLNKVFANPIIADVKKRAIADELFSSYVSKTTLSFIQFVVHKHRAINLKGISARFLDLYLEAKNTVVAHVVSAVDIDHDILDSIREQVAAFMNKDVVIDAVTTDKMLGGFQLSFDTYLYDARIRTLIDRMRKEFAKNIYESKL